MIKFRKEIESLRAYVPGRPIEDVIKEYNLDKVIKLASNENPYGCSDYAKEAVIKSLSEPALYPDGNCTELRALLSKKLNKSPEQFIFGAGSDEIIAMIGRVFINQDDEAITCTPSFSQYKASVATMGGKMIEIPLKNHTFDLDGIVEAITEKTKIIFIANPNNPTGTMITAKEQLDFIKKVPDHILIVLDEAYYEYVTGEDYPKSLNLLDEYKNIIVLRTFSKMYGLASLRIGYGVGQPEVIDLLNRVRPPFNVSKAAQVAAIASLEDESFVNKCYTANNEAKEYTYSECKKLGLNYIETQGNFIMIDFNLPSNQLFTDLQKLGFIVRPGFYFGMDTYQRITLGTLDQMKEFFTIIKEIID